MLGKGCSSRPSVQKFYFSRRMFKFRGVLIPEIRATRSLLISLFIVGMCILPGAAQVTSSVDVTLDGQRLFPLSGSNELSAQERVDRVNQRLAEAVQSMEPVQVQVDQQNNVPTISLNDRYLLTITQLDAAPNLSPKAQANLWAQRLQEAIQTAQAERTPAYLRRAAVTAMGVILGATAISVFLNWSKNFLARAIHHRFPAEDRPSTGIDVFFKLTLILMQTVLWIAAILSVARLFPFSRRWSYRITSVLVSSLTSPVLTIDQRSYSALQLIILGVLLTGLVIASKVLTNFLKARVLRAAGVNRGSQEAIAILVKYTFITLGAIVLLQLWGLNISSLAILASALGIGIGFGLQDIAKNFVSGLVLVFERPIQVGDFVQLSELYGSVERIGARSTEIRTVDHVSVIVPNSRFLQQEVINWSHRNPVSRLRVPVGVSYSANPEAVRTALLDVAKHHTSVLQNPSPQVFFKGFGESELKFDLLVWIADPSRQFRISSELYFEIFKALQSRDIEIPYPQRDLHVRSGTLSLSPHIEAALLKLADQTPQQASFDHDRRTT